MIWTGRTQEWILDHGFKTDENGKILIPKSQWKKLALTGTSMRNPQQKTLCIPADDGLNLIFEWMHFEIVRG